MARQTMQQHANTFSKGMNKDLDYSLMEPSMYLHAENLRLVADEANSTGALENVKGNTRIITKTSDGSGGYYYLIGYTVNGEKAVLFYVSDDESHSAIYKAVFDGNQLSTHEEIYNDSGLSEQLGFTKDTDISAILRKENTNIERLYWLDGDNGLMYLNIANAPDSLKENGNYISPNNFLPTPSFPFKYTDIQLSSIGNGSFTAGMVQYAYQFVSKSGSQTPISPLTGLYHITKSNEQATSTTEYKGTEIEEDANKSFTFNISIDDTSAVPDLYDEIKVYSIFYKQLGQVPVISEMNSISIESSSYEYKFTDDGQNYIGELTLTELLAESSAVTSSTSIISNAQLLESKDNRLFLADVETKTVGIDIGNYDPRAFRYNSSGYTMLQNSDGTYIKNNSGQPQLVKSVVENTDLDIDAINPYNSGSIFTKDTINQFKYKSDGSTLGAEGANIDIDLEVKQVTLDDSNDAKKNSISEKDSKYGFKNYASPYYTANFQSYQRDEIYRFAIKFFDDFGNETSPLWICDFRMPHIYDPDWGYKLHEEQTNKLIANVISPKFTIKNFPSGVTSYQILRTERTSNDKSIISQGIVRPTMNNDYDGSNPNRDRSGWQTCVSPREQDLFNYENFSINNELLEFYSPDISFYTDSYPLDGDEMEIIGYLDDYLSLTINNGKTYILNDDYTADNKLRSRMHKFYKAISKSITIDQPQEAKILWSKENLLEGDFPETTNFFSESIGGYTYWTYLLKEASKDRFARKNASMVYGISDASTQRNIVDSYAPFNDNGTKEFNAPMIANYRRNNYDLMYGGNTYAARNNNKYVSITNIIESSTNTITPYRGDTFVSSFDIQPISYEWGLASGALSGVSLGEVNIIPLESTINMELRMGTYATGQSDPTVDFKYMNQDGYEDRNIDPLYVYNTVYSRNNNIKKDAIITEEQKARTTNVFNNRIVSSDQKINGEKSDSWLRYPANNYIDVDSSYGTITELLKHSNRLYYFQERGIGVVSVNDRSLIQDQSGQQLVLGTGTLLSRFDYLSTDFGCSHRHSIVETLRGIYWFDIYTNSIVRMSRDQYNNMQIISLSKANSMQPFMNKYDFNDCVSGKDEKHDEVLFTLSNDSGDIKTLVFNERMGVFQSLYSIDATNYINVNRNLLSTNDNNSIYIHSRDDANYGEFYGTVNDSTLKTLVSPNIGLTKVFDVMNYINQSEDSEGNFQFYDTFDQIRVYNTYQNSDWVTLVYNDTITKRGKDWSLQIPRNAVTVDLEENPNIFSDANLDASKDYKERMRDKYLFVDFVYQNDDGYRFNIPVVITKYRISYR